jgi:hypothetical protein
MTLSARLTNKNTSVCVDEQMAFPNPHNAKVNDIEWKMRYSPTSISKGEMLIAASVLSAYRELVVHKTHRDRNLVCSAINAANR